MGKRIISASFAILCLISADAISESVYDIEIGAYYFLKGTFSDDKIRVIEIDKSEGRVKIYNPNSKEVDWVNASSLITRSESIDRDISRLETTVKVIDWMLKPSSSDRSGSVTATNNAGGFKITNNCRYPVNVAIHFKDLSGSWRTEGWWKVDAGSNTYLADASNVRLKTDAATWYYYAERVNDKNMAWKGNHMYKLGTTDIPMLELTDKDGDSDWVLTCAGW